MDIINQTCPEALTGIVGPIFLTLIQTLFNAKCTLDRKNDYPENYGPKLQENDQFDFIIIGTGPAGSIVANKLTENPNWQVLVLEAGDYPTTNSDIPALLLDTQGTHEDWQYGTVPSENYCKSFKNGTCRWPRGKVLGGSGSINAMLYVKPPPKDYDDWNLNEWKYDNIKKYIKDIEDIIPLTQYDILKDITKTFEEGTKELGLTAKFNEKTHLGYKQSDLFIENGMRANPANIFLNPIKHRKNFKLALNAFVEKLVFESNTNRVKGVQVRINGQKIVIKAQKEVIISAGTINSAQLLMLSGIGPEEHLTQLGITVRKNLAVGENLADHPLYTSQYLKQSAKYQKIHINLIDEFYKYIMYHNGMLATVFLTDYIGFIDTKKQDNQPNIGFLHALYPQNHQTIDRTLLKTMGLNDAHFQQLKELTHNATLINVMPFLTRPKSKGYIRLNSKSPDDKPLIYPNYLDHPDDIRSFLEAIRHVEQLVQTEPFQKNHYELFELEIPECSNELKGSDAYHLCRLRHLLTTVYHPVGTCKMGSINDPTTVVDERLKVKGFGNLRVIDASVMPDIVTTNTHATTLVIGAKGAAIIIDDWRLKDEL